MLRETIKNGLRQLLPPVLIRGWGVLNGRLSLSDLFESTTIDQNLFWYCPLIGGWLTAGHGNLAMMARAIETMPTGGSVVEIGSFMGQSTNVLVYLLRKYGRTEPVFSCDPWEFGSDSYTEGDSILQRPGFAEFAQEAFKLNCRFFSQGQEPKTFALTSDSFFEQWREESELTDIFGRSGKLGGPISFAFVDGLHTAEAVRRDFQNVDTWLLPGGYVLLDDTGYDSPYPDCRQFAFSLLKHPGYEVIRRSPNFLFRKKK